jgi:cysteinyl-tRNA synthetase
MYVCGMTVYSDAHIGHARTYLAFDVIRRYFEYKNYNVIYVQNITDVDDKIIAAANKEGVDPLKYSERFAKRCFRDLDELGIRRADFYPKASETIPDMIKMIQQIISNDYAYVANGDVYFSVEKYKKYGRLSGQKLDEMKSGARVEPGEKKKNPLDFALWKKAKPGEPFWDSPWGKGRPGWHIECSTMSSKYLGLPFDIHGGGMDLRFPHHENEVAQCEAATGKQFAKYWMHIGLLTIEGEKMSKSLGNIINVSEVLKRWDPEVVRMFFAQTHYRRPPDFNEKALRNTAKGLEKIYRLKERLQNLSKNNERSEELTEEEKEYLKVINNFKEGFERAMDDDFNTPRAFAAIFDFVNKSNRMLKDSFSPSLCKYSLDTLTKLGGVLTLFQPKKRDDSLILQKLEQLLSKYNRATTSKSIEEIMEILLRIREEARKRKDWVKADGIRKELTDIGFELQDTNKGTIWKRL